MHLPTWTRSDRAVTRARGHCLVWLLGMLLASVFPSAAAKSSPRPAPPNFLFILCDDLGVNDLRCYGRADHRTPHLDRLAAEGTRFTTAYCAQPICSPSRAAILTGKAPARLHLTTYLPGRPDAVSQKVVHPEIAMQVPLEEKLISEHLAEAGYVTAAFGKWHVGGHKFGPLEQGFRSYHPGQANTTPSATEGGKGEYGLTAAVERFLETNQARPFFAYLAHNTPHIPYAARPATVASNAAAFEPVYAAVIETLDDTLGRLMATLDRLKLASNTVVVFTSDNGGLHVPEGPHPRVTHNTPFRAGKGYVYEGGLRVPLIVRWPGRIPAGRVAEAPVINTDWLPTLLDLADLPVPDRLDGASIAGYLTGQGPAPARPFFWHFPHYNNQGGRPCGAMREGRWMLVDFYDDTQTELYDLETDIRERTNLASAHPDRVAPMRAALAAWRQEVGAQTNRPNPACQPERFQELYVEVDPGRFDPASATPAQWTTMQQWRKGMTAAIAGARDRQRAEERSSIPPEAAAAPKAIPAPAAFEVTTVEELWQAAAQIGPAGGIIRLAPGRYVLTNTIEFQQVNCLTLEGSGWSSVLVKEGDGDALRFTGCGFCVVRDLNVMAGRTNTTGSGLCFAGSSSCTVDSCRIVGFPESGVRFQRLPSKEPTSSNRISNCHFIGNLGAQLESRDNNDFYIVGNQFGTHGRHPQAGCVLDHSSAGTYTMNYHWDNRNALRLGPGSNFNRISNNRFEESGETGVLLGTPDGEACMLNIITGNTFHTLSKDRSGAYPAVHAWNVVQTTFTDNQVFSWNEAVVKHTSALVLGAGCRQWIVKDNLFRSHTGPALVFAPDAGHLVKDNLEP